MSKWESCSEVVEIWLEGKWNAKKRTAAAIKTLETWCDGGSFEACWFLAKLAQKKACQTKSPRRSEKSSVINCS